MSQRFLPTASLETLQWRAKLVATLREFFTNNGYWECDTPILSRELISDANLDPFVTQDTTGEPYYLQTSPEAGMKRLLVAGATAIFQITRAMRRGESGRLHNPEFSMVEWYCVGDDHHGQMSFVEQLVRIIYAAAQQLIQESKASDCRSELSRQPFERLTYDDAFERFAGTRVMHLDTLQLRQFATDSNVEIPPGLGTDDRDGWLNLLLSEMVEPQLGRSSPQFVYDYPASQAALAKVRHSKKCISGSLTADTSPPVAERFELYDRGIELCNGYHELTDADEFSNRTMVEQRKSGSGSEHPSPGSLLLENAMLAGLPDCSGVALGLDRLVMMAIGYSELSQVIAFPADRA